MLEAVPVSNSVTASAPQSSKIRGDALIYLLCCVHAMLGRDIVLGQVDGLLYA